MGKKPPAEMLLSLERPTLPFAQHEHKRRGEASDKAPFGPPKDEGSNDRSGPLTPERGGESPPQERSRSRGNWGKGGEHSMRGKRGEAVGGESEEEGGAWGVCGEERGSICTFRRSKRPFARREIKRGKAFRFP